MDVMKYPQQGLPRDGGPRAPDLLEQQAKDWVRKLGSGAARRSDARALERWCATSPAHRRAFAAAHLQWAALRPAAELAAEGDVELHALRRAPLGSRAPVMRRRVFMGGAVAASATAAGVLLLHPPMDLWPSLQSMQADYKTGTGEQRLLALAPDVKVELNTRSSISLRADNGLTHGIDLVDGEVAVDVARTPDSQAFTVFAGGGRVRATRAVFEVRQLAKTISLTCREGVLELSLAGRSQPLASGQRLVYGRDTLARLGTMGTVSRVDNAAAAGWREGILSFHRTALAQVVEEINRYRPGRVVLIGQALAVKPVSGRFYIRDLDMAIAQIQRLFRLEVTSLPGGVVVLS
ncbi:MAG: DUF4880 domain-containing protein [Variovorax sp.]|nr:MAG: DUF4880 domain-containing protein [Variovorax sp.]